MSVSKSTVGAQLHKALKERIHNRLEVLAERKNELSFTSGETLSRQDCHQLQVTLNDPASKRLWTASQKEDGVENCLYNLDEWLQNAQEKTQFMNDVPRYFFQGKMTVSAASIRSSVYHRIVFNCIDGGLFHNEDFSIDGCGFEFDHLNLCHVWSRAPMESLSAFYSVGHPHVTITSVQPQQGQEKELLCTEFWTLQHWAQVLARRVYKTKTYNLPLRLVSVCDTKARIICAEFSRGYLNCLASKEREPKGRPVNCQVEVAPYRDLTKREDVLSLTKELTWTPIGNEYLTGVQKKP